MYKLILLLALIPASLCSQSYWQQDVQYKIDAALNPKNHTIVGKEKLIYKNNSPDVLSVVYFRLYWDLFTEGSYGHKLAISRKQFYRNFKGSIKIKKFAILDNGTEQIPDCKFDNTLMTVKLSKPLQSGDSAVFSCEWEGEIPENGYRTGYREREYNIAQWYPQIATYDKYGWDKSQYLGISEFHNEFGIFDVNITVPKSFTLGYTGILLNPEEVYPDSILRRLKESEGNTETIRIADNSNSSWASAESTLLTWKFHAENVRDFAWSASEHYIWDATSWTPNLGDQPVRIHSLYSPENAQYWKNAAAYGQHAISYMSQHFGTYSYHNCFIVEGIVGGGMEYPGITFIGRGYTDYIQRSLFGVVTHEVAHNWYPMMVGTNETYYAFMDEGFATFMTALATEDYFGRYNNRYDLIEWYLKLIHFRNDDERQAMQRSSLNLAKTGYEEPISTHTFRFEEGQEETSIYSKTGSVLFMLQYVMGDSLFEVMMKKYFTKWQFKHPYPEDFYALAQDVSGNRDLRWFFDEWFNRSISCDYGISYFDYKEIISGTQKYYRTKITVRRFNAAIMPIDLLIEMADNSKTTIWFPIDAWLNAEVKRDTTIILPSKPIRAELNPDGRILDINRLNNRRPMPRFDVQFDNTIFNVTPVDAYLIKWRPSFWFTDRGGWNLGYKVSGSYLADLYSTSFWNVFNARDKTINYDLKLQNEMYSISPLTVASFRLYRIEGRKGIELSLQKEMRRHYSVPPFHKINLTYSYSKITDKNYLWYPQAWEEGNLHRLLTGYSYYNRGSFWKVNASAELESTTPIFGRSDFQYSKRTFQIRTIFNIPGNNNLLIRFYNGVGYGNIPNQTKYYFANSSPIQQIDQTIVRSKGVLPQTIRDHTVAAGGGFMRGYYRLPVFSDKIDALNAEARFSNLIPFVNLNIPFLSYLTERIQSYLFFDAGRIAPQSQKLWDKRFEIDLGWGIRTSSLWNILGEIARSDLFQSIGLNNFRIDFPLYVSKPYLDEYKLKFRWSIGFSTIDL